MINFENYILFQKKVVSGLLYEILLNLCEKDIYTKNNNNNKIIFLIFRDKTSFKIVFMNLQIKNKIIILLHGIKQEISFWDS